MVFMKEPYGIVCEENRIHLYDYKIQKAVKSFRINQKAPQDFCINLALGQIIDLNKLLKMMDSLEKTIFFKMMENNGDKYFLQTDYITQENIEKEILQYESKRIGANYANSLAYNAQYKVYKKLKENIENTTIVVCGGSLLGSRLMEQLLHYSWSELYLLDEEKVTERDIFHCSFYQKEDIGKKRSQVFNEINGKIKILEKLEDIEKLQKKYTHVHIIYTAEEPQAEIICKVNRYMEEKLISWSLLAVDSEKLIIGPTIYPGQTGCLSCNFNLDNFFNKYNLMPYEANLMTGVFMSDIGKIIGVMEEAIVEDISITIGRTFYIDRQTMEGRSIDMERQVDCPICGPGKKASIYKLKSINANKNDMKR